MHLVALLALAIPTADPVRIDLAGPRKAVAEIAVGDDEITVRLSMLPVRAFDAATNDEISGEMARELAFRALARHYAEGKDVGIHVVGDVTFQSKLVGDRFQYAMRVPRAGISPLQGAEEPAGGRLVKPAAFRGKLFTAKQDHLDTLAALVRLAPKAKSETLLALLDLLEREVKADKLLTDNTERPEVLDALGVVRTRLQARADALKKFARAELTPPFDEYLTANPLLMEVGGAIVVELGANRRALVGISKTILNSDTSEEILRAETVCKLKARAALIAERDGSEITYLKQVKDRIEIVKEGDAEKATSVSELTRIGTEKIKGIARGANVVGRWRSADGKIFYLAVGVHLDAKGEPVR